MTLNTVSHVKESFAFLFPITICSCQSCHLPIFLLGFALFLLKELFICHHFTYDRDCKYCPLGCHLSSDFMLCPDGVCSLGKEEGKREKPAVLPQLSSGF